MVIWLWLVACSGNDPELKAMGKALHVWSQGEALLDQGDAAAARERFAAAREHRDDALLIAWEASAAAEAGDLEGAVALLDGAIARAPRFAEARYNRAAYLARLGRAEPAAADLRRAIDQGAATSLDALEDPDFAPWLDHEAFGFLPRTALTVTIDPPAPTAFLGGEVALRMRLVGIVRPPFEVRAEEASGPLELTIAVEDHVPTPEGASLDLSWTFRVAGAGAVRLGPFEVVAGKHSAQLDVVAVEAAAPPGRKAPPLPPLGLALPSQKVEGLDGPGARLVDGELRVRTGPGDRVQTTPPAPPASRYEHREGGAATWVVFVWPEAPAVQTIRIEASDGMVRWEGAPSP